MLATVKTSRTLGVLTWARLLILVSLAFASQSAWAQANVTGQWVTLGTQMPINPIHVTLMHNGKVLIVSGSGNFPSDTNYEAAVWDPVVDTVTTQPLQWDGFCNGMIELPDGRPFVISGTIQYDPFHGDPRTFAYNLATGSFVNLESMAHGRWYPTATTLSDGSVMVFSGLDENGNTNTTVEIYRVGVGWGQPQGAGWTPPLYPRMHLLPNGKVFYSGSTTSSAIFNPTTNTWQTGVATTNYSGTRTYGTSVLLPLSPANNYKPVVMIMGGGSPATNTTELIDLSASSPNWVYGPNMSEPRIEMDAVILPNGKVLAVNGSTNDEDATTASFNADLYDPNANSFSSAGANAFPRLYHSGALLLPDATVLTLGGNPMRGTYEPHLEIYSPAYLFNADGSLATRPSITATTPGVIGYGAIFQVQTPDAANVSSVVLMRPGSPTHAFDMDQRLVVLNFSTGSGVLNVTAPPNGSIAPPGSYMLFILNSSGVPSLAQFLQLSTAPNDQPPTGMITSPVSNVTIAPGQSVSFSGTGTSATGTIAGYSWVFPGGSPATSNLANPGAVTYSNAGTYVASLTVTDNSGVTDPNPPTLTVTVTPDFSVSATPTVLSVAPGGNATTNVTVTPAGQFLGTVTFSVTGLPSGVTPSFNPSSISGSGSSTLTLSATTSAVPGTSTITITGTSGSATHSTTVTLNVTSSSQTVNGISIDFVGLGTTAMGSSEVAGVVALSDWNLAVGASNPSPLSLMDQTGAATTATVTWTSDDVWDQPIADQPGNFRMMKGYLDNGLQDTTTVTVKGLPSSPNGYNIYVYAEGASNNSSNTGIYQISGAGITTSSVALTYNSNFNGTFTQATASSPIGNYVELTIPNVAGFTLSAIPSTASSGYKRAPVNGMQIVPITPPNPDFNISATPSANTVGLSSTTTYTVSVGAFGGFTGTVTLNATGLPAGATPSFSPATITASGSSTLTVTTSSGTPVGSSTLSIAGTSGSLTHSANVTLNVSGPDFMIAAAPSTASVIPGGTATYTVNIGALFGFTDTVTLGASGLPAGAFASFSPASITAGTGSTLTVTTSANTPGGNATLTITGTGTEGLAHSTTVTMNVTAPDFTLTVNPSSTSIISGGTATYTASVTALNGFTGSVSLAVTAGLPSGGSPTFVPASITTPGNSTLTITTTGSTPTGSYPLTITGTSGALTHSANGTLDVTTTSSTNVISIDFVGLDVPMGSAEVAGVVPKSNWNNASGAKNPTPLALVDETGAATTASVTWTADDVWAEPITDQPGSVRMIKGYLDNGNQDTTVVNVSGLPPDPNGYSVYVYADGAAGGSNTGIYQISGTGIPTTSEALTYTSNFAGTFTQATASNPVGNYVILTIPATSAFTLSAIPSTSSSGYERAPINGMQIVPLGPPNPDFTISATPASQTVLAGNSTSYTINVTALNGFNGTVNLAATGLPSGATPSFSSSSISVPGSSTLTVTTAAGSSASSQTITITGTSGSLVHSATATLNVTAPDFTISASPGTTSVAPGGTATYTVSVGALNGFTGAVSLAVTAGLPSGASPTFVPTSITTSGSSTLTITTTTGTALGNATLTITGTAGSLTHSANVILNVTNAGSSSNVISIDFVGLGVAMGSSEVAGVVAKSNWNNAGGASSSGPLALVDETGTATNVSVSWTADDVWDQPITDQPGNVRMMKGYLDNGNQDTTTVNISGLPSDPNGFNVYVYAQGASNNSSNTGIYQISGTGITTTSATLTYNSNFNGTFTQATASSPIGNYVVLTIPNVSAFTLSAIPSTASTPYKRAALNGIQIVPR
jgi:hypothetical protein